MDHRPRACEHDCARFGSGGSAGAAPPPLELSPAVCGWGVEFHTPPHFRVVRSVRLDSSGRILRFALFCPHPLCPPLPQAGEGERAAGRTAVRPYTPLPQGGRGAGGEGYTKCAYAVRSELKRCTLISCKQGEPNPRAPRGSPREAGGTLRRGAIVNSALAIGIIPTASPKSINAQASNPPHPAQRGRFFADVPARGVAEQRISAAMRARRSRSYHARRWERGRPARRANRARKNLPL